MLVEIIRWVSIAILWFCIGLNWWCIIRNIRLSRKLREQLNYWSELNSYVVKIADDNEAKE